MNTEMVNNRVSQLPIAMAGIVHAFGRYVRSLSKFADTAPLSMRRRLP
ncbi:RAxF-45 family protein [Paenibacillus silvisoli]